MFRELVERKSVFAPPLKKIVDLLFSKSIAEAAETVTEYLQEAGNPTAIVDGLAKVHTTLRSVKKKTGKSDQELLRGVSIFLAKDQPEMIRKLNRSVRGLEWVDKSNMYQDYRVLEGSSVFFLRFVAYLEEATLSLKAIADSGVPFAGDKAREYEIAKMLDLNVGQMKRKAARRAAWRN